MSSPFDGLREQICLFWILFAFRTAPHYDDPQSTKNIKQIYWMLVLRRRCSRLTETAWMRHAGGRADGMFMPETRKRFHLNCRVYENTLINVAWKILLGKSLNYNFKVHITANYTCLNSTPPNWSHMMWNKNISWREGNLQKLLTELTLKSLRQEWEL